MRQLFDTAAQRCAKLITEMYSTSFTLGIKTLDKSLHTPIYSIYGFVRMADEIVDTLHEYDKATLFERFRKDTYIAIDEKVSLNPVLHAFQLVVNEYKIDHELIEAFLTSMKMDLVFTTYNDNRYHEYIYGSAEVVGLMCLKVFCKGNQAQYNTLKLGAQSLGSAFQKVNFLRDMRSDFEERGRVYFPSIDFERFTASDKAEIEQDIQTDFDNAYAAILKLPIEARLGVLLAYKYYTRLFAKIKVASVSTIQTERVRVPDYQKIGLLTYTILRHKLI